MTDQDSLPQRIRTFVLEPDIFFRNLAEKPAQYSWPLLIAIITGVFSAVSTWLMTSWMFSFFITGFTGAGPDAGFISTFYGMGVVFTSVISIFPPLIIPIIAGLGFYFLAGFVSRGGSLSHAITAAGWGMIPLALYKILEILLFLAFRPGISVTISPEFFTMLNNSSSAGSLDKEVMAHMVTFSQSFYTFSMVLAGLHVLAFLCCAWFWIPAVRNTCNVSHRHATMIVLIPLLLYLAVSFGPVFITGGHGL